MNEEALKVCGRVKRKRVEWLTDVIKQLVSSKHRELLSGETFLGPLFIHLG